MTATQSLSAALADRYEIERLIGERGMATVYLARDLRHHRRVALKVLRPDLGAVFLTYGVPEGRLSKIYIAPFPNPGNVKWLVSPSAGIEPVWSNSGEELFYRDPVASTLVAVPVHTGSAFSLGAPKVLFPAPGTAALPSRVTTRVSSWSGLLALHSSRTTA